MKWRDTEFCECYESQAIFFFFALCYSQHAKNQYIIEIGNFEALEGEAVVDAGGLALAPGFVAMQDYYDHDVAKAIYKMTGLPAAAEGTEDRGRIRTGYIADLVLFDPATIEGEADMQDLTVLPVRVDKVWVSGVLVFDNSPAVDQDQG